jgi:hypothetical protein
MLNFTNKARPSLVPLLIPPLATLFLAQSHYANTNKSEHRVPQLLPITPLAAVRLFLTLNTNFFDQSSTLVLHRRPVKEDSNLIFVHPHC